MMRMISDNFRRIPVRHISKERGLAFQMIWFYGKLLEFTFELRYLFFDVLVNIFSMKICSQRPYLENDCFFLILVLSDGKFNIKRNIWDKFFNFFNRFQYRFHFLWN